MRMMSRRTASTETTGMISRSVKALRVRGEEMRMSLSYCTDIDLALSVLGIDPEPSGSIGGDMVVNRRKIRGGIFRIPRVMGDSRDVCACKMAAENALNRRVAAH